MQSVYMSKKVYNVKKAYLKLLSLSKSDLFNHIAPRADLRTSDDIAVQQIYHSRDIISYNHSLRRNF